MKMQLVTASLLSLALAACGGPADNAQAPQVSDTMSQAAPGAEAPAPSAASEASEEGTASAIEATENLAAVSATIPDGYIGVWGEPGEAGCSDDSDSRVQVHAQKISFWESEAAITGVSTASNGGVDVTADVSGEGETWKSSYNMRLDGASMYLSVDGGAATQRTRCQ